MAFLQTLSARSRLGLLLASVIAISGLLGVWPLRSHSDFWIGVRIGWLFVFFVLLLFEAVRREYFFIVLALAWWAPVEFLQSLFNDVTGGLRPTLNGVLLVGWATVLIMTIRVRPFHTPPSSGCYK